MEEYSIKKFAHYLVMQYSNLHCTDPDLIKILGDFKKEDPTKDICNSIDLLLNCYKKFVDETRIEDFHKFAYDKLMDKTEYMQYLISRCLKLSEDDPTFFEFLLVCVYICKMANILFSRYKCCKILKMTAHSLEAVYFRKYSSYFDGKEGFRSLSTFCKHLNGCRPFVVCENIEKEDTMTFFESIEPERTNGVEKFKALVDVDGKITLNRTESKFLEDESYITPSNRPPSFLLDWGFDPELLKNKKDSDSDIDLADFDTVPEKVYKTGLRCDYCLSKCFQYPLYSKKY